MWAEHAKAVVAACPTGATKRGSRPCDADGEGKVEVAKSGAAPPPGATEHAGLARLSPGAAELDGLAAPCRAREEERAYLVDLLAPHPARSARPSSRSRLLLPADRI